MNRHNMIMAIVFFLAILVVGSCSPQATPTPQVVRITQMVEGQAVEVTRIVDVETTPEPEPAEQEEGPNILRIGHEQNVPDFVDPHRFHGRGIAYLENMYEPLAYPFQDTQEIRPVLAESWEVNDDGSIWTFTLKDGIQFHDGSTLDAETVKFSFERLMAMGEALQEDELNRVVKEISTPDERTVVFTIESGGAPFLAVQTAVVIVSKQAAEGHMTDEDPWAIEWFSQNSAGTGPYRLAELRPQDTMRMVRFEDYWGGWEGNHVDEVVWLQIPEPATQALMLERGEIDISFIVPLESVEVMRQNPDLQVFQERGNYVFYLRMNNHGGPLTNETLRMAFAHAFNYDAFIEASGEYFPAEGPVPSHFLDGWVPENLPEYDIELAKQYYSEAGYGPDNPLAIEQFIVAGQDYQRIAAEILQQGLQELGVDYTITPGEFAPYYSGLLRYIEEGDESGYLDMFTLRMPSTIPDPVAYFTAYKTGNSLNMMGYSNPDIDAMIDEAVRTPEQEERISVYQQSATRIVEDYVDIWLGVERRTVVMSTDVEGFVSHPLWWPALHIYPISLNR